MARAIRAARKGGLEHPRVEIGRDGCIVIMNGPSPADLSKPERRADASPDLDDELEAWRAEHGYG